MHIKNQTSELLERLADVLAGKPSEVPLRQLAQEARAEAKRIDYSPAFKAWTQGEKKALEHFKSPLGQAPLGDKCEY